jgi:Mce-associated membrane protein
MRIRRASSVAAARVAVVAVISAAVLAGCSDDEPNGTVSAPPPANLAFVDVETSRLVLDQISPAVARFYSYDFRQLDEHAADIREIGTARFWSEIEPTLELVRSVALSREVVATAEVVGTSLRVLEPGRAELLLFVDRSTTETNGPPQQDGSSVLVNAARIGSQWKIDGMKQP